MNSHLTTRFGTLGGSLALFLTVAPVAAADCGGCGGAVADHEHDIVDTAVEAGSFETLTAALAAADLVDALEGDGPFTVFAPTDAAFAKLPAGTVEALLKPENRDRLTAILTYHVAAGELNARAAVEAGRAETLNGQRVEIVYDRGAHQVRVDGATVVEADIACSNGVIHVIDEVILPSTDTILETAAAAGSFETLAAAIEAAGLVDALSGDGPFTVFAPTDEAFAALPEGALADLLKPENRSKLQDILKLHVVSGRVYSDQAVAAGEAEALQGGELSIAVTDGVARVDGARLVTTDIEAANGVIHVIDAVILPGDGERQSRRDCPASRVIEYAVERGSALFNHGDPRACAELYALTARSLLELGAGELPAEVREGLQGALTRSDDQRSARRRAWTLRRALDTVYGEIERAEEAATPAECPAMKQEAMSAEPEAPARPTYY